MPPVARFDSSSRSSLRWRICCGLTGSRAIAAKSFLVTWLPALLVGVFGVDRFYLAKVGSGILKLITFGGFGIWVLFDLIFVLSGAQRDKRGQKLAGFDQHKKIAWIVTGAFLALSIIFSSVSASRGASDLPAAISPATSQTDAAAPVNSTAAAPKKPWLRPRSPGRQGVRHICPGHPERHRRQHHHAAIRIESRNRHRDSRWQQQLLTLGAQRSHRINRATAGQLHRRIQGNNRLRL